MARIKVNHSCGVLTNEHSNSYRSPGRPVAPEITVPQFRARLSIDEARRLSEDLAEAVAAAKEVKPDGAL